VRSSRRTSRRHWKTGIKPDTAATISSEQQEKTYFSFCTLRVYIFNRAKVLGKNVKREGGQAGMIKDFDYFAPRTLIEALTVLDKHKDEYKIIAGGQSLLILMRQGLVAPENLIDIYGIPELKYLKSDVKKGLLIGALTTHRTIETSALIDSKFRALAEMEHRLASRQTRNRGTIGGNICHGDPAGDPAPVLMAFGASVKLANLKSERTVSMEDFSLDYFETALQPGEMLVEIQIPTPVAHSGAAHTKFNIIESDMATVGVAVWVSLDEDARCSDVRIALGAAAPKPMRAKQAEDVLKGKKITEALLRKAGQAAAEEAEPVSDISASEDYRRELVKVLVPRVAKEALARARA
jgi:carbon-monoxide dehydrogenase medium subunit